MSDQVYPIYYQNGRLISEFTELDGPLIGEGGFGVVIKAKHIIDNKYYAIKKINFTDENDYPLRVRELKVWAELDCDYFVQYRSSWLERLTEDRITLHIQMDLCWFSLEDLLLKMCNYFELINRSPLPPLAYYISSELLIEVLESFDYLHNLKVIHRDIKPNNVLIKVDKRNGRFVKLADFGLSIFFDGDSQTHTKNVGTERYMAPEMKTSGKYGAKADVYSIGVLIQDLFNFDINRLPKNLSPKYQRLIERTGMLLNGQSRNRPTCGETLTTKEQWAISFCEVQDEIRNRIDIDRTYDTNTEFINYFLQTKLKNQAR